MKTWKWVLAISAVLLFAVWTVGFVKSKSATTPKLQEAATAVQEQAEAMRQTRTANDREIKKAVKSAVEKADSIDYNDVCDEFNAVISGARERNAERRCSDSAD